MAAGRRGRAAETARAARLELDGERALRQADALAILKGGSDWLPEGSDWYVNGGPQDASYSLKLLLLGAGMARSPRIGFRLAVDLP